MKHLIVTVASALFLALPATASENLYFECALANDASTGVRVQTHASEFNNGFDNITARIEIYKKGILVVSAENASIGERLPVTRISDGLDGIIWAMNVSLGRSGAAVLGYDVVNGSWNLSVSTMNLQIPKSPGNAVCRVSDSSGMSR